MIRKKNSYFKFKLNYTNKIAHSCHLIQGFIYFSESFRAPIFQSGPDKNGFSLGKFNNFTEVFGVDKKLWFIPVFTRYSFVLFSFNI